VVQKLDAIRHHMRLMVYTTRFEKHYFLIMRVQICIHPMDYECNPLNIQADYYQNGL